ncbi:MAG: hypothetical protein V1753_02790, partial [Pseudomonadota bacterium]
MDNNNTEYILLQPDNLLKYLQELFEGPVEIIAIDRLGISDDTIKKLGYGETALVTFIQNKEKRSVVFSTMKR